MQKGKLGLLPILLLVIACWFFFFSEIERLQTCNKAMTWALLSFIYLRQ